MDRRSLALRSLLPIQRLILVFGASALAASCLFPPWTQEAKAPFSDNVSLDIGPTTRVYRWILSPPTLPSWVHGLNTEKGGVAAILANPNLWNAHVDAALLSTQLLAICFLSAAAFIATSTLGENERIPHAQACSVSGRKNKSVANRLVDAVRLAIYRDRIKNPHIPEAEKEKYRQRIADITMAAGDDSSNAYNCRWLALTISIPVYAFGLAGCALIAWHFMSTRHNVFDFIFSPSAYLCAGTIWFCVRVPPLLMKDSGPLRFFPAMGFALAIILLMCLSWILIWGTYPLIHDADGTERMRLVPFIPWPSGTFPFPF